MSEPSARYIITRAIFLIAALIALLTGLNFVKKIRRQSAIIAELKSVSSDSSFFHQFYAEDARKSLVRGIALMAEAKQLGIPPETSIDRCLGIEEKTIFSGVKEEEPSMHDTLVRTTLRNNYENFLKLGYKTDFQTLRSMKEGALPPIPSGPQIGKKPVIANIIDPALSPGIDKVIANLEIRPPQAEGQPLTDIEIASAKRLANDLAEAKIIEQPVRDRILAKLAEQTPK